MAAPSTSEKSSRSKLPIRYLALTSGQVTAINSIYGESLEDYHNFDKGDDEEQRKAQHLLKSLGLDRESRSSLDSRWNIQWSNSWEIDGGRGDSRKRILFQCSCGYDPKARQTRERTKAGSSRATLSKDWDRRVPYDFTGCLAHVEIIERCSDGEISRIAGHFLHNSACQSAVLKRLPAVPLHEHVYEVALEQLESGASITAIQTRNREMVEGQKYRGMHQLNPQTANWRYHLLPSDNPTLYRKFSRKYGVDVRKAPQYNIDDWLNPSSPEYKPLIREAIFHYSERSEAGERFQVCISTPEMKEAAWKYAHHSQLVLDGTFGVCSSRLLLFIALACDENRKGVPIAFFLFSAPTGNRATQAGYDTLILQELLSHWKTHLGKCRLSGELFTPYAAITDTDTKERGALLAVWPLICLLICRFHLRQCWTNYRKTAVRGKGPDYWKDQVRNTLRSVEIQLLASVDHTAALALIQNQQSLFKDLEKNTAATSAAQGGIKHLNYLAQYWMPVSLWKSWSEYGRLAASALLKIPVEGVIPTTNHLESFNGILKRKHLPAWLHSGRRLRFDSLIYLLIIRILPGIYSHRRAQKQYADWLSLRFRDHSNGANLVEVHQSLAQEQAAKRALALCWWEVDPVRDANAENILKVPGNVNVSRGDTTDIFIATCASSSSSPSQPIYYTIHFCRSGASNCSCPDFQTRGGACKHLRAVRLIVDHWILQGYEKMPFIYHRTHAAALSCHLGLLASAQSKTDGLGVIPPMIIPPTSAAALSWDPATVQALGADTTVLGGDDGLDDLQSHEADPLTCGGNGPDSDSSESSDADIAAVIEFPGEDTPTHTHFQQQSAITTQVQQKVDYNVKRLLPSLHGLASLLSESTVTATQDLVEFSGVISAIQHSLGMSLGQTHDTRAGHGQIPTGRASQAPPPSTSSLHHSLSVARTTKRTTGGRPVLLPPSPERRQRRKDSHAPF